MPILFWVGFITFGIVSFLILSLIIFGIMVMVFTGVPFAPTPSRMVKRIIEKLRIKNGDVLYDLGSGDGRILFASEKAGADARGFEISFVPYIKSKILKILIGSKVKISYKNFYKANLSDADIVFCFLVGRVMERVEKKLDTELRVGTKVVSYGFHFPNWLIQDTILPDPTKDKTLSNVYIYKKNK